MSSAEATYQRLLAEERPSSEALALLSELDSVLHVEGATEIVDKALNGLRADLQGWFRTTKKNVANHETEAIEAERR